MPIAFTISVDKDVYNKLEARATGFDQTPSKIIRELLEAYENPKRNVLSVKHKATVKKILKNNRSGKVTTQAKFIKPLLVFLLSNGGSAHVGEIRSHIFSVMEKSFKPEDFNKTNSGREAIWWNNCQWCKAKLKEYGFIGPSTGKGIWSLSDEGTIEAIRARDTGDSYKLVFPPKQKSVLS